MPILTSSVPMPFSKVLSLLVVEITNMLKLLPRIGAERCVITPNKTNLNRLKFQTICIRQTLAVLTSALDNRIKWSIRKI